MQDPKYPEVIVNIREEYGKALFLIQRVGSGQYRLKFGKERTGVGGLPEFIPVKGSNASVLKKDQVKSRLITPVIIMSFLTSSISTLQTVVTAIGAGLACWGVINLLEGYGNDNPGAKSQGIKQLMAGGGVIIIALRVIPQLSSLF